MNTANARPGVTGGWWRSSPTSAPRPRPRRPEAASLEDRPPRGGGVQATPAPPDPLGARRDHDARFRRTEDRDRQRSLWRRPRLPPWHGVARLRRTAGPAGAGSERASAPRHNREPAFGLRQRPAHLREGGQPDRYRPLGPGFEGRRAAADAPPGRRTRTGAGHGRGRILSRFEAGGGHLRRDPPPGGRGFRADKDHDPGR